MNDQPLVSVIVASYNHGPYIEPCILSVLKQSYPNIELIVVDDGSTDDSIERITRLRSQHQFDFRTQPNQGLARTLNDCISRARGSLIAPFGSDDIMLPDRMRIQVDYMQGKPEVGVCAGGIEAIDENGAPLPRRNRNRSFRRLDFNAVFASDEPGAPAPTLLFRRDAIEKVGGFDPSIGLEDLLIELKITRAGYFIDVLSETLAQYRIHGTNTYKNRRFMIDSVLRTYAQFSDHPEYPRVCARFINSMLLKCARSDKELARQLLKALPLRCWNSKTFRALVRLMW